ncbi:MAG TPA: DUF86 domain-containing protein [Phycisphaerales bacterium]|nr:DUF86 domain-containing protein [Phycisphaerales bacterium]
MPEDRETPEAIAASLGDMIESIDAIGSFLEGVDRESFASDLKTMYATRAAFTTLGEAANRLPESFRDAHDGVPWKDIRRFRNFVVHVYDKIDVSLMWDTAVQDLPPLREQLAKLLESMIGQ